MACVEKWVAVSHDRAVSTVKRKQRVHINFNATSGSPAKLCGKTGERGKIVVDNHFPAYVNRVAVSLRENTFLFRVRDALVFVLLIFLHFVQAGQSTKAQTAVLPEVGNAANATKSAPGVRRC